MISLQKAISPECENSWYQKSKYDQAEKEFYEKKSKLAQQQPKANETLPVSKPEPQQVDKIEPEKAQPKESKKVQKLEKTESPKLPKKKKSKTLPISPKDQTFPVPGLFEPESNFKPQDPEPITEPDTSSISEPPKKDKKKKKKKKGAVDTNISADGKPKALNGNVSMPSETTVQKSQSSLEKENEELKQKVNHITQLLSKLELRVTQLEKALSAQDKKAAPAKSPAKPAPAKKQADDDDGVDLFASESEEEDEEAAKIKEQRLAEYNARKSKKPVLIAKSNIILDVKPWDDETDMKVMETEVRKIKTDGLIWGASKLVPLAYGIHKLQISCVVEDDKVSVDWLQETIQELEDYVQSVDIAAFNKV